MSSTHIHTHILTTEIWILCVKQTIKLAVYEHKILRMKVYIDMYSWSK